MKIAIACPASLPATQFGGIMFLAIEIARESTKMGNEAIVYTTDLDFANNAKVFNRDLPDDEIVEDVHIKRSHVWFKINLFFINPKMYLQMMRDSPDIIHTIGVRSFQSFVSTLVARKKNIPLIISDQGGLTTHPDLKNGGILKRILYKMQTPMIHFVINNAAKISVANEYEKNIFLNFCSESKIEVIRNGINLGKMKTQTVDFKKKFNIQKPFILFLGRFSRVKGIDVLLKAIKNLKDRPEIEDLIFVIMGVDFGFQKEMFQMIKEFKIENKIKVLTNPSRDDVIAAYRESEFLVLPSRWELSPLTPLEGFAFKKAVISTNTHGIPFTITNGENGILIEEGSFEELAESILELINNKMKRVELGLSGYKMVQSECNSKSMVEKTLKMYKQIINE